MEDCIDNNHIHQKDIRNIKPKSTYIECKGIDFDNLYDKNSESNNLSNDKNQVPLANEHTQPSPPPSTSIDYVKKENKKNIFRIGNSDTWGYRMQI
jgi:hypothetical protein